MQTAMTKRQLPASAEGGIAMLQTENYYEALFNLAATINSTHSPEEVVRMVVERVANAMGAKGCSLMLLTPDRSVLLHTATYGLSGRFLNKGPVAADRSMTGALDGLPVIVLDATTDERIQYPEHMQEEGIASILSVPLKLRGKVAGVLRVYTAEPYRFTRADVEFATAAANFAAIALENARFYDALEKDYETFREEILQWRAELGDEWMMEETAFLPEEPEMPTIAMARPEFHIPKELLSVAQDVQ